MRKLTIKLGAMTLLLLPLLLFGQQHLRRPPRTNVERVLFQGIVYKRESRAVPRPFMLHIVTIDLTAPGIKVLVTPGNPTPDNRETNARTTSEFLKEFKLQLAINANFFYPFREENPWDYYPRSGERTNAVGQAISQGFTYSPAQADWPVLCFSRNQRAQILASGNCPQGTVHAVAGSTILLKQGLPLKVSKDSPDNDSWYSRTIVATDRAGEKLWLIAIDDKQPLYSEGVTLAEASEILQQLGAYTALNLDGGGSTTLVVADSSAPQLLNAPIHTKIPMRERPVANHLGFFAQPLKQ